MLSTSLWNWGNRDKGENFSTAIPAPFSIVNNPLACLHKVVTAPSMTEFRKFGVIFVVYCADPGAGLRGLEGYLPTQHILRLYDSKSRLWSYIKYPFLNTKGLSNSFCCKRKQNRVAPLCRFVELIFISMHRSQVALSWMCNT